MREKPLQKEMPYLGSARLGHDARFADNIFKDFELFETVADEEYILLREQKSEKC